MGQYYYIPDPGEQRSGFTAPVPDRLAQLRQNQMQQPMIPGPTQPQPTPPAPQSNPIWVQGEEGAKAYMVAPGSSVMLMDSENTVFYLKSSDQSGMPLPLRIFDYTERSAGPKNPVPQQTVPQIDLTQFITRDELEGILAERLRRPSKPAKTKEDTENG